MILTVPGWLTIIDAPATALAQSATSERQVDRTVLPIHEPQPPTITTLDARDAKAPPRFAVKAPAGAPNIVIVVIDDIGFGTSRTITPSPEKSSK
jgi:arylsulfatase